MLWTGESIGFPCRRQGVRPPAAAHRHICLCVHAWEAVSSLGTCYAVQVCNTCFHKPADCVVAGVCACRKYTSAEHDPPEGLLLEWVAHVAELETALTSPAFYCKFRLVAAFSRCVHAANTKLMAITRLEICSPEYVAWVAEGSLGPRPSPMSNDSWQLGCLLAHLLMDHAPFSCDYFNPKRSLLTAFQGLSEQEQHVRWGSFSQHPVLPFDSSSCHAAQLQLLQSLCPSPSLASGHLQCGLTWCWYFSCFTWTPSLCI